MLVHMARVRSTTLKRARALRRKLTSAETILWWRLKGVHGLHFKKQHPVGPFIADFACAAARLIIEVDGGTHGTDAERCYDARRDAWLARQGWRVVRIANADVCEGSQNLVETICALAQERLHAGKR
jgi:crossover junction endodeoxyribonuclease RuvC/BirA family biotin operon repressor/biotin-[acetyl-CoA-carboxylase] ligase